MTEKGAFQETEPFRITSLQEALDFAVYISRYGDSILPGYNICDSLRNIYAYSRIHSEDDRINGKLFNAYIDLELTYLFTVKDVDLASGTYNQLHSKGKIAGDSVLQDFDLFSGKVDILNALSALSFRIRAFWDKYMGILFLLYEGNKYEGFINSRSRKKFFVRNAKKWPKISLQFRKCLTNTVRTWLIHSQRREAVREIDRLKFVMPFPDPFLRIMGELVEMSDAVRTPEAHGSGFLRKWSLANFPIDRSRDFALINQWNVVSEFMNALRATFGEYAIQKTSPR